ncbi:GTP-binding protein [Persephonella sp.]
MVAKILVTGHFSAGKTQFITTLTKNCISTEVKVSSHEEKIKNSTTVAMDYGKISISGVDIHLFGTPGQDRFDFMLEILGRNHDGAVVLIDSTDKNNILKTERFIQFLRKEGKPFVIACNKQDIKGSHSPEKIADLIGLPPDIVLPLSAVDHRSCMYVIDKLINHILSNRKAA